MPEKCVVPGCNKAKGHRFPANDEIRLKWIHAIRRLKTDEKGDKSSKKKMCCGSPRQEGRLFAKITFYLLTLERQHMGQLVSKQIYFFLFVLCKNDFLR